MIRTTRQTCLAACLLVAMLVATQRLAFGQVLEQTFTGAVSTDYNIDGNWVGDSGMVRPDVDLALEIAAIGSNTPDPVSSNTFPIGIADLTNSAPDVGRLILGFGNGAMGTLNVSGSGAINVKSTTSGDFSVNGEVVVGGGSIGSLLTLSGSGTITADRFTVTGGNAVNLEGSASVTSRGISQLLGTTTIAGPNVTFDVEGNLTLGGTFVAEITNAASHSIINTMGSTASLVGNLNVDFSAISPPNSGDSWEILRAGNVTGQFSNINTIGSTPLGSGQALNTRVVDNGGSESVEVFVEQLLTLRVDRANGNLTIVNTGVAAANNNILIDGYTVTSATGSLNTSWNSLDAQNSFGDWLESNPTPQRLSELKESGSTTVVAGGNSFVLAGGWMIPTSFAVGGDLEFQYTQPDGTVSTGLVEYTGPANNLVLQIDPASGEARIVNQSQFSVDIDGYTITSADGALLTSWNSLDDQNAGGGDWRESNPTSDRLSEIKESSALTLDNSDRFELGTLYDVGSGSGSGDVVFEFLINDSLGGASTSTVGEVVFATIPDGLPGDFNNDGTVNLADYTVWRNNLGGTFNLNGNGDESTPGSAGVVDAADYALWKQHFGSSSGAAAVAAGTTVPEPGCIAFAAGFGALVMLFPRRASSVDTE